MELYKLYCILKRHTGYETMRDTMRRVLMPEEYRKASERAGHMMAQLRVMQIMVERLVSHEW